MKRIIPLLFFFYYSAFAQDYIIRQDQIGEEGRITFEMLDATDGYTPETGLSPTCTIKKPLSTSYSASTNSPSEIGNGTYQIVLSYQEYQNAGLMSLYCTGVGSRPKHIKATILESGSTYRDGANYIVAHSNYGDATYWSRTGVSITTDSTADFQGQTIGDTVTGDGAASVHKAQQTVQKPEGSGLMYLTTEVKTGSLNNAWIGDCNYDAGVDINTSTGAITNSAGSGYIRGWKVDKLASSWWRVHLLYSGGQSDTTAFGPCVALGNGTATGEQSFTTSGTMIFAKTKYMRAEDVSPTLLETILPNIQSAASSSSITLDTNETTATDALKNREICFQFGYTSSVYWKVHKYCGCISAYNGTTKVVTLSTGLPATLNNTYKYNVGGLCMPNVNVNSISADAITASAIQANAIGASEIADNSIDSGTFASGAITAGAIATDAIGSAEFSQASADKVWNTAPQDGTATTALGYLDAIKKYVANKMTVVGSDYEIFKDDQTTSYATGTTNSAGRDPD